MSAYMKTEWRTTIEAEYFVTQRLNRGDLSYDLLNSVTY